MHRMCRNLVAVSTLLAGGSIPAAAPEAKPLTSSAPAVQASASPSGSSSDNDSVTKVASLIRPTIKPLQLRLEGDYRLVGVGRSCHGELYRSVVLGSATKPLDGLGQLARRPEQAMLLAPQLQQLALDESISYEVRLRLEELLRRLPLCPPTVQQVSATEIEHLLDLLDDDSFASRNGAAARLRWLSRAQNVQPNLLCPLMTAVHARLVDPDLSSAGREEIGAVWAEIHGLWLLSDSGLWNLPAVKPEKIKAWIDDLATPARSGEEENNPRASGRRNASCWICWFAPTRPQRRCKR